MFLLPAQEKKSPTGDGSRGRRIAGLQVFLPLLLSPSLDCYHSKSTSDGRFRVVTERKQPNRRYRPVASDSRIGQLVDRYVPPGIANLDYNHVT
ncbi:hypothetical protein GW17_00044227 [Ensete ventricosum]|nr:hypothetical protein GW17_00044227 [Ensete ventricosum]RZR98003.1 hypothetical protein BHM03_00027291 [Ensete ventricosum]